MNTSRTGWTVQQLYEGCLLASLAHAIMVSKYPDLSYEHAWDGINYNVQDGAGRRGTISFAKGACFGAFRVDDLMNESLQYQPFLDELEPDLQLLAKDETLQYLLEEESGQVKPIITTMFWTDNSGYLVSPHDDSQLLDRGGQLLERQVMELSQAIEAWKEYYDMSSSQVQFMLSLFNRKLANPTTPIRLTSEELALLGDDEEGLNESFASFQEINIQCES